MSAPPTYQIGGVYFRLTFPDSKRFYPKIESFVFIGKNVSDEYPGDAWYFQFVDGYARHGSVLTSDEGDRRVAILLEKDLSEILDVSRLTDELEAAAVRRKSGAV